MRKKVKMRESSVERKLGQAVRERGCLYYKFVSPGNNGVPDRIILTPSGGVLFVELKQNRGKLSPSQKVQIAKIRRHGQRVLVVHGTKDLPEVLQIVDDLEKREFNYTVFGEELR